MTVYKRDKLEAFFKQVAGGETVPVYLLTGDRYLCREAADRLGKLLLADGGTLHPIDGDREDYRSTLGRLKSFSLLPGRQLYRVMDSRLFHSKNVARKLWDRAQQDYAAKKYDSAASYLRDMLEAAGIEVDTVGEIASLSPSRWKSLFGFAKPDEDLSWLQSAELDAKGASGAVRKPPAQGDPASEVERVLKEGIPASNILMLIAETVDKRKRLYKYIVQEGVVLDLSVKTSGGAAARREQRQVLVELVRKTLADFRTELAPGVLDALLERVGFHPVAVVRETEKLALYVGDKGRISREDLDAVVGRTRQEAVFELTECLGKGDFERVLLVAERLHEHGVHDLAVISVVRKYVRTLLLFRALQEEQKNGYRRGMTAATFQHQCLPKLKQNEDWSQELSGHPYAVFMQFKTAEKFSIATLRSWLHLLLEAEYRLKGSPVESGIVISHLFLAMSTRLHQRVSA